LAPTPELLKAYRDKTMAWGEYEAGFFDLLQQRKVEAEIQPDMFARPTALLCSELKPDHCHRRLIVEYLRRHWGPIQVTHL
jgi:uncharacterized protein YeaO (DUF488 family)